MKNRYVVTLMLGALLALGGCASSLSGDVYSRDDARAPQTVRMGTVESVRLVQIEGTKTVIGPAAGAAIGGVAGSSVSCKKTLRAWLGPKRHSGLLARTIPQSFSSCGTLRASHSQSFLIRLLIRSKPMACITRIVTAESRIRLH